MTDLEKKVNNDLILYRLDEIKGQLADFKENYVTKEESHALKVEISELRTEIHAIKNQRNILSWIIPTVTSVFTAIFTLLVVSFLNSKQ